MQSEENKNERMCHWYLQCMNCGKELSIEKEKDVKNSNDRVFD
jgi:ribosomal protein S26